MYNPLMNSTKENKNNYSISIHSHYIFMNVIYVSVTSCFRFFLNWDHDPGQLISTAFTSLFQNVVLVKMDKFQNILQEDSVKINWYGIHIHMKILCDTMHAVNVYLLATKQLSLFINKNHKISLISIYCYSKTPQ